MQREYSHFKPDEYSPDELDALIQNAFGVLRSFENVKPLYPDHLLFQVVGFMERIIILSSKDKSPVKDDDCYTQIWADRLNFATCEFINSYDGCAEIVNSIVSGVPARNIIAASLLNPLFQQHERAVPIDSNVAKQHICQTALELPLVHAHVMWTQTMYDNLIEWYPPALLMCTPQNIPPMAPADIRTALEWASSIESNPNSRLKQMHSQFQNMISPNPSREAMFIIPYDATLSF